MAALGHFRQLVQEQCKPVVQNGIIELGKVLGVSPDDLKQTQYADPEKLVPTTGGETNLGWQAKRSENLYIHFLVCWDSEPKAEVPLSVGIDLWIKDRKKRDGLQAKLDQHVTRSNPLHSQLSGIISVETLM
jgi:hypothetical protein